MILKSAMYYVEMWVAHVVAYRILADFRVLLYKAVERVSPSILLNMRAGQLSSTLMGDVEILEWFFAHTFGVAIVGFLVPVGVLLFMTAIDWRLTAVMLVYVAVAICIPLVMRKRADGQGSTMRERLADANAEAVEGIQALREIVTLNYKSGYLARLRHCMDALGDSQVAYGRRLGSEGAALFATTEIAMVNMLAMSAWLVYSGSLEFEWFAVVIILAIYTFAPIIELASMARNFGIIVAASNRVFLVLESEALVHDSGKEELSLSDHGANGNARADMSDLGFDIEFSDVSFSYGDNGDDALKGVSFKVHTGETVALVGHSGAGKSTCINLLLRFWDVRTGEIRIGSRNIKSVSLESLRNTTSAVLQEVYLFNTTIRDNIRLGSPNASDREVEAAARHALAHEFIDALPDGYDTVTGEKGTQLSGGQRQRIAIARAILRDAPILILDEAVSNLDTENEHDIQRALKRLRKGRTTLVIAHRLSTILSADRLVVLDRGRVAEAGAHEELVNRDGVYRELVASQFI